MADRSAALRVCEPAAGEIGDIARMSCRAVRPCWPAATRCPAPRAAACRHSRWPGYRAAATARPPAAKGNGLSEPRKATAACGAASVAARKDQRRNTDTATDQYRLRAGRIGPEAAPDRAQQVHQIAGLGTAQRGEAVADHLVEHLDPALAAADTHDRQRPAHRNVRIAADVHEGAGCRAARTGRGVQANDELVVGPGLLIDDAGIDAVDGAAVRSIHLGGLSVLSSGVRVDPASFRQ
jgi:hypothetical protein